MSKAIDKAAGAEREVVGRYQPPNGQTWNLEADESRPGEGGTMGKFGLRSESMSITAPATDAAKQWEGWGTALKPAWEPIIMARKPIQGTVADNVQRYGTGAINVDECRIEGKWTTWRSADGGIHPGSQPQPMDWGNKRREVPAEHPAGRWPANVVLDEESAALLDQMSGSQMHGAGHARDALRVAGPTGMWELAGDGQRYGDTGGASRFFYTAKASRSERGVGNSHPTVKPLALMRWLVTLVTPPNGYVLDPFMGSGTTIEAAKLSGFHAIGIDTDETYCAIAVKRIAQDVLFGPDD